MEDEIFWDAHEELLVKLDRKPTREEVQDYLKEKFKTSEEEKVEYYKRKLYGK